MPRLDDLKREYLRLAHAMQAGVAMWQNYDPSETTPKHLRTGVNSAMADHGALVKLLIDKGILTEEEYMGYLIEYMAREVEGYKKLIRDHLGGDVDVELV